MHIAADEIHIWSTDLNITAQEERGKFALLSEDEKERALRFYFPIHKQRFIAARSMLRIIIGHYLNVAPEALVFAYDAHEKPYLHTPNTPLLQFNLSHSDHLAVYAFSYQQALGVDIEKIQDDYHQGVAERYFSPQENQALMLLPATDRAAGFYRIWARKEALIKATGKGLTMPLNQFSVSCQDMTETIELDKDGIWTLIPLSTLPGYQAAVATQQSIKMLSYWTLSEHSPKLLKVSRF